ncbi:MAG TPA: DUF6036 family nucleotidyltransferase [Tepidisphaeraceae bacterium]|nr:DUF6036 family nucleotidyltransferase [Tepidisphaeraceae bacterium]
MESTRAETVLPFFRELGASLHSPTSIAVGGSVALILAHVLSRRTEDIDVVDEIPVQIRLEHDLLHNLAQRYGLKLTHFQSHYLPAEWQSRATDLGVFGQLTVRLVDAYDIFVGKLFSRRDKDRDDLRAMVGRLDKQKIVQRLRESGRTMRDEESLRREAEKNWYIVFGEPLPQ